MFVKTGDKVKVIAGKDKGKEGTVPGTNKKYKTKDKFVPKFKAGKGLKDAVAAAKK